MRAPGQVTGRPRLGQCALYGLCLALGAILAASTESLAGGPADGQPETDRVIPCGGMVQAGDELLAVTKAIVDGRETVLYEHRGRQLSAGQLREELAASPAPPLGGALRELLAATDPQDPVSVVVYLRDQPAQGIARQVGAAYQPLCDQLSAEMRQIVRRSVPAGQFDQQQERELTVAPLDFEDEISRRFLAEARDRLMSEARGEIAERIREGVAESQETVTLAVRSLGGEVTGRAYTLNLLAATLPAGRVALLAGHPGVRRVEPDMPGEPELNLHKISLGLTTGFWPNGIDGGVHDCGVLDTGVQQNHSAFAGKRFFSNMGTTDPDGHGTGVCGIMASENTTYTGMAFALDAILVARAGADSTSMSGADSMLGYPESAETINYSFGNGTANMVDYRGFDAFFDAYIDVFDIMFSKSTGNSGWGTTTITHPAPAYNLLANANMDDLNSVTRSDDVIASTSSRGPTLAGRKKPDLSAPGNRTMSTYPTGGFLEIGGTSAAAPHTGGGIILLWDLGAPNTTAAKAVLINTADAWDDNNTETTLDDREVSGSLWNKSYGWGYLDLGETYLNGLDVFVDSIPDSPEEADFRLYKGPMLAGDKATLVWRRHVTYNGAAEPPPAGWNDLSDLDLTCWRESDQTLLDASESHIDNVEQIDTAAAENVVLKVEAFGSFDPDVPTEDFALATEENFAAAAGPAFALVFTRPDRVRPGQQFEVSVQVTNTGDLDAHNNAVTLAGVTIVAGANPQPLGRIADGAWATAVWTVEAPPVEQPLNLSAQHVSLSYGESFTGNGQSGIVVGLTGKMYWTDAGAASIQRANLDGTSAENLVVFGLSAPAFIAVDAGGGKMYWADRGSARIQRADLSGVNVQNLVTTGLVAPFGMALDPAGGKMYWTDPGAGRIQRANLDGTSVEELLAAPADGIALDVAEGKMYWTDSAGARIRRADLNGSNVEDLVTGGLSSPVGLALDLSAGKMYWTDAGTDRIQRADLDGTNVEDLLTSGLVQPQAIDLDPAGGRMYWADAGAARLQRALLDGSGVETIVASGQTAPTGLALEFQQPALALLLPPGSGCFRAGEPVPVTLRMSNLRAFQATGFQAFLAFDPQRMSFVGGAYTDDPFGLHILDPIAAVGGGIDLAAGINQLVGQDPTLADSDLAALTFQALAGGCGPTRVSFPPHVPPTGITDGAGRPVPGLVLVDSPDILIDAPSCLALPGDFDGDGDVDLSDFTVFQLCFGGSNNPPAPTCPPGVNADLDGDCDADLADFLIFQQNFTGAL